MSNKFFYVNIIIGILIISSGISSGLSLSILKPNDDYINITPEEAWDLLKDTSNGIQIPIDVRMPDEWHLKRIDTPFPEYPRRYSDWTPSGLEKFLSLYNNSVIILYCKTGGRSIRAAEHILDETTFNGTIYNMVGGIEQWIKDDLPFKYFNHLPNQPETPIGPTVGTIELEYCFSTITTDRDDDAVRYGWSWDGDEVVDEWTPFYASGTTAEISYNWSVSGTYEILVLAEDHVGEQSQFSEAFTIKIKYPPNPPNIKGKINGAYNEEYEYTFSSMDPENVNIYFYIEWGDGDIENFIGPYQSEEEVIINHTYTEEGNYTIRAKAKDIYDIESDWSTLAVSMPRNQPVIKPFNNLLQKLLALFNL